MTSPDNFSSQNQDSATPFAAGSAESNPGSPTSLHDTVEKVRRAAGQAASDGKDKVADLAEGQKGAAADKLSGYSSRLRDAAHSAEGEDPNIAHFANQAADRLETAANYVRDTDFARLKQDAAAVARRHPALFMGGMLVAGLILGNVAKASVQSLSEQAVPEDEEFDDANTDGSDSPAQDNEGTDESADADRFAANAPFRAGGENSPL